MTNVETGEVMSVEFMLRSPTFERVAAPYIDNLKRIGIEASQEQKNYWTTDSAEEPGSWNIAGIANPVLDALVDNVISAPDRESLVAATQALDRALLWLLVIVFFIGINLADQKLYRWMV